MLTEMVYYACKIEDKVKAMQCEIKNNIQGTNSEGKKRDSNQWFVAEGKKKRSTRTE